jgi:CRISPR-associated protein Cas1
MARIMARTCISNKIHNQEALLAKIRAKNDILRDTADKLHLLAGDAIICGRVERLLGIEGNAARYFFHEYYREMDWIGRYPRTKIDRNNLLLDMGYTFLFHFIEAMLCLYGFDLYEGFYHTRFYQRKSLVCDIEEPFRPIIDEAIRKAYNLGQVSEKDF